MEIARLSYATCTSLSAERVLALVSIWGISFLARGGKEYFLAMAVWAFARSFPRRTPLSILADEGAYRCLGDDGSRSALSTLDENKFAKRQEWNSTSLKRSEQNFYLRIGIRISRYSYRRFLGILLFPLLARLCAEKASHWTRIDSKHLKNLWNLVI